MADQKRRDFLGMAFGGVAAVGAGFSLVAMKQSWDPLPSVLSAGFTTVDLSPMTDGEFRTITWRGKPIFVLKHTADMKKDPKRTISVPAGDFSMMIGLCTHLGCIPSWAPETKQFKCACHGGEFDENGIHTFGPPPRPLDIPPFKIDGNSLVLGEEGPEYKAMMA